MNISNLNNINNINNIQNTTIKNAEEQTESFKDALEKAQASGDDQKLKAATQQFEEMFVNMMMKNMRSTIKDGGLTEKSYGREMFEGMLDEEISKEVVKGQGIGIAQMMYEQLSKTLKSDEEK